MNNLKPRQMIELAYQHNLSHTEIVYAVAQCARYVLPLTREQDKEVCLKAIEAAEKWCREPTEENRKAANIAADAVYAAAYAAASAAYAAAAAYADAYADAAADAAYATAVAAYSAYATAVAAYSAYADTADAAADAADAAKISSDEEINQIILQYLPKLQRIVSLKVFW